MNTGAVNLDTIGSSKVIGILPFPIPLLWWREARTRLFASKIILGIGLRILELLLALLKMVSSNSFPLNKSNLTGFADIYPPGLLVSPRMPLIPYPPPSLPLRLRLPFGPSNLQNVGKSGFVSHTKHIAEAIKHGSISFKIDNMHYVNFRI